MMIWWYDKTNYFSTILFNNNDSNDNDINDINEIKDINDNNDLVLMMAIW